MGLSKAGEGQTGTRAAVGHDKMKCCCANANFQEDEDWDLSCCCISCWCRSSNPPMVKLVRKDGKGHFGIVEHANEDETCCRILCRRNADCQSPEPQPHIHLSMPRWNKEAGEGRTTELLEGNHRIVKLLIIIRDHLISCIHHKCVLPQPNSSTHQKE